MVGKFVSLDKEKPQRDLIHNFECTHGYVKNLNEVF